MRPIAGKDTRHDAGDAFPIISVLSNSTQKDGAVVGWRVQSYLDLPSAEFVAIRSGAWLGFSQRVGREGAASSCRPQKCLSASCMHTTKLRCRNAADLEKDS